VKQQKNNNKDLPLSDTLNRSRVTWSSTKRDDVISGERRRHSAEWEDLEEGSNAMFPNHQQLDETMSPESVCEYRLQQIEREMRVETENR